MSIRSLFFLIVIAVTLCVPAGAQDSLRPLEGAEITHIHTRFRWDPIDGLIGRYYLQVVEDNGSLNPFQNAQPVIGKSIPGKDPRTVVTEGLEFGKDYAWRVLALVSPAPGTRTASSIHRFSTLTLPTWVPDITITVPPGAGPVQPGLTIFNRRIGGNPPPGGKAFLIAVDEAGEYVWFYEYQSRFSSDFRQLDDGRFLWLLQSLVGLAGQVDGTVPGRAVEMNLDGKITWISKADPINSWVHHDCSRLPNGNTLLLTYDSRILTGVTPTDWIGDRIVEVDRHTKEVVGSWSTFDDYSLNDFEPQFGPGNDWVHGNAAFYDEASNSVYYSARHLSRITRIDWGTKDVLYSFGKNYASGDVLLGDGLFAFEHAPEVLPNGNVLLFDNGNTHLPLTDPRQSAAVEMAFDDPLNPSTATVVWRYDLVDDLGSALYSPFLGDADRQPNGNTLITAGPLGIIFEVDAASQLVWKMKVELPFPLGATYRADRIDSLVKDTPGDMDDDWDLDLHDLAGFQNHYQAPTLGFPEKLIDTNSDGALDDADFDNFFFWMTGPANELAQLPT